MTENSSTARVFIACNALLSERETELFQATFCIRSNDVDFHTKSTVKPYVWSSGQFC